jgi:hypothetical protein
MIAEELKARLDKVLSWPPGRQRQVAEILALIEEQETSGLALTAEQADETRRRRSLDAPPIPAEEVFARFRGRR